MWSNITYFLKAVIPVAEESGVRLALHPNDPPAPISRGSEQIMGSVEGWKHLIEIVPSKSNGITFDCGVTREMGQDPVEVCRYFGSTGPHQSRAFPQRSGAGAVREIHRSVPGRGPGRHVRGHEGTGSAEISALDLSGASARLDADRELPRMASSYPGGGAYAGFVYNVGYTRAMLQAALT